MKQLMKKLWKEEEGQDLVEYALLITLVSLALVAALTGLSSAITTAFNNAVTQLGT
jgi:pilus assembly protein Flp/PilA